MSHQQCLLALTLLSLTCLPMGVAGETKPKPKPKAPAQAPFLNLLNKTLPPLKTTDPSHPPGAAQAGEAGALTLQSSVQSGLTRNPYVKVADERVATALAQYDQAKSSKNLKMVFSDTTFIRPAGPAAISTSPLLANSNRFNFPSQITLVDTVHSQINVQLQLLLTTFGRVEKQIAASFLNIDAQAKAGDVDKRNFAYQVKTSFLNHLKALAQTEAAKANLEVSQQNLSDSEALFKQGLMAKFDVVQADLQVTGDAQRVAQTATDIETTRAAFRSLLVLAPDTPVLLVPPGPIVIDPGITLKELNDIALQHRPELIALHRQLGVAQTLLEAAENESNPQVGMNLGYYTNPGNSLAMHDTVMLGFNFSWSIFDGGLGASKVAEAESQIRSIEDQGEQMRLQVLLDVETSWLKYLQTYYDLQTAEKRVVTALVYYDMARQRFVNGLGTSLETQEALRSLNNARVNLVVATYSRDQAFADLEQSLGTDFFDRHLSLAKEAGK
ncbi:TolC family protein [bacterium]|nr:TolC family protein [bacterium]